MRKRRDDYSLWELFSHRRPITPASSLAWVGLTALAYAGNVLNLPLFFNVDFLFGSIFVFVVLHYYGWGPATVSALIASSHTAFLWQHPYSVIIFSFEVFMVGIFYRRRSVNLMFLDTIYWVLIGMPLVVLFYGGVMGIAQQSTVLIVFKQAINGILNALIAALLIGVLQHIMPALEGAQRRTRFTFSQAIFLLIVTFVLIPAMAILVVTARAEMDRVEEDVASKLSITTFSSQQAVNAWLAENMQTLRSLAGYIDLGNPGGRDIVRTEMALLRLSDPDFLAMALVDARGEILTAEPREIVQRWLGNGYLAGTRYFAQLLHESQGSASNVIDRDGSPIVVLGVPIQEGRSVAGAVLGVIDVTRLRETLFRLSGNWTVDATLLDANARVVASTAPDLAPFESYEDRLPRLTEHEEGNLYIRVPETARNVSIMERWQHSRYLTHEPIGFTSSWSLVLRAPIAPYQDALNRRYQSMLLVMLLVVIGTILLSAVLSRRMLASLTELTVVAENLPDKVTRQEELDWPSSRINEIETLIDCFRVTSAHLSESFSRIQEANLELIAAKQQAEDASKTKTEFLANISHDLRTPLNGILGYAQILSRDSELDARTREAVSIIEKSGNHLLNLINDILDVSRIEAQKLVLVPESFRLRDFLEDIADIVSLQARQKGLQIHTEFHDDLPQAAVGDQKRLRQVLLNLLNNAVKFTDSGEIWFRAKPLDDTLYFEVEDTGVGIPDDQLQEIFSPFKQLSKHIQSEEGTGLGLAIVQRLVKMMGGEVRVRSTPGVGSTFSFTAPLQAAGETADAPRPASAIAGYEGRAQKVLVVDDKWENRSVLRSMLEPIGFPVLEASDGRDGIEVMEAERPSIVFMDLVMPVMDGFEAIRTIRDAAEFHDTKVIAISASVAETIKQECLRVGFDGFLPKPFRQFELFEMIRKLTGIVWVHQAGRSSQPASGAEETIPPAELLEPIERFVAAGNIRRILEAADEMRSADERYQPVADRITKMAQEFQVNRLASYLNDLRHAKVSPDE
ncbi:MAG: ATP-binding protein [Spirochaetota bacterium]